MFVKKEESKGLYYKAIVVSSDIYPKSVKTLNKLGIEVIWSHKNLSVSPYLSKHADMQIVKACNLTYISTPECYEYYKKTLEKFSLNLICGNTYLSSNYPCDIAYNIVIGEKYAIHNFKHTDSIVKENLFNKKLVDVSQGYCSCTICSLPGDSFITSDFGVAKALLEHNDIKCLQISQGNVLLNGFDYGFFGGASFMIGPKTLAVNGDISTHPDYKAIVEFCEKQNTEIISLSPDKIMDIGSAVPIA